MDELSCVVPRSNGPRKIRIHTTIQIQEQSLNIWFKLKLCPGGEPVIFQDDGVPPQALFHAHPLSEFLPGMIFKM